MTQTLRRDRDLARSRLKYEMAALRVRLSMLALDEALSAPEEKLNPNHDPANGRFTSGGGRGFGGGGASGGWTGSGRRPDAGPGQGDAPILPGGGAPLPVHPSPSIPSSGGQTQTSAASSTAPGETARISPKIKAQVDAIRADFERQTGLQIKVTSGVRTPEEQAQAMYDKLQKGGSLSIYANQTAAAEVQAAYDLARKSGAGMTETVASMASVIQGQVRRGVYISKHLTNMAIDISTLSADRKVLARDKLGILFSIIEKNGGKILHESNPTHIHVQFQRESCFKKLDSMSSLR